MRNATKRPIVQRPAGVRFTDPQAIWHGGGGAMNDTLFLPDEPLRDLPPDLQQAVRKALAVTHCLNPPPCYDTHYWREEREAIANCTVWQAAQTYRAEMGISREVFALLCARRAIYTEWQRLCERDKRVVPMPVDAETGEEVEFEDEGALEATVGHLLCVQVQEALERLSAEERRLLEWYFGEGLSEREIAQRWECSHVVVHKRLQRAWKHLGEQLERVLEAKNVE